MKLIFAFLLIGLTSAASFTSFLNAEDLNVKDLVDGWSELVTDGHFNEAGDDDINTELGKVLKDGLDKILEKIKEAVNEGKEVKQEFLDKLKELGEKLRKIKAETGEKSKELIRQIKEEARDYIKRLLEKYGLNKRSADGTMEVDYKEVHKKIQEYLKEYREKLRKITGDAGEKSKELIKQLKKEARDYINNLLKKYGINKDYDINKRLAGDTMEIALAELNYRDVLRKIKEHLKNNVDPELLKASIEKIIGQGSELLKALIETLKEKGRRKLEILIDRLLDDDNEDERETRSIKDFWEKVKDYFKRLNIDLKEKFMKFGEWVKTDFNIGLINTKDKLENIKAIAKEFIRHINSASKEVSMEAREFFEQYKEELGDVWEDLKEAWRKKFH